MSLKAGISVHSFRLSEVAFLKGNMSGRPESKIEIQLFVSRSILEMNDKFLFLQFNKSDLW